MGPGCNYRHWEEVHSEGSLLYTEHRHNCFVRTEPGTEGCEQETQLPHLKAQLGTRLQEQAGSLIVKTWPKDQLSEPD